jgi:hypothetical protein
LFDPQTQFFSAGSAGRPAPQINGQAPGRGYDQPAPGSSAQQPLAQLLDGPILGLPAQKAPGHFDQRVTHKNVVCGLKDRSKIMPR